MSYSFNCTRSHNSCTPSMENGQLTLIYMNAWANSGRCGDTADIFIIGHMSDKHDGMMNFFIPTP